MSAQGELDRLPEVGELLVYTPDPDDAGRLVEIAFPGVTTQIDFEDAGFEATVRTLIESADAEAVTLCDRIRATQLPLASAPDLANVRFELALTPDEDELAAAAPGTDDWMNLPWPQGIASSEIGVRQATLRVELQVEPRSIPVADSETKSTALPFFGSATYRYAYRP
jgi:hypothetical protein